MKKLGAGICLFGAMAVFAGIEDKVSAQDAGAPAVTTEASPADTAQSTASQIVTPQASDPLALALRATAGLPTEARAFYEARGFQPVWVGDETARKKAEALLGALADAPLHALPAGKYDHVALTAALQRLASMNDAEKAGLEAQLTRAFLTYAQDISSGVLEPRKIDRELYVYPERPVPSALMTGLTAASDPAAYFASLAPASPDYARLLSRYQAFTALAGSGGWGELLTGRKTLRQGERSTDTVALRDRLTAMGYFIPKPDPATASANIEIATAETTSDAATSPAPQVDPYIYDADLELAVKQFQARHGLNEDGVVGPATRAALNVDPAFRAGQIAVNLERLRWLNRDLGTKHILVNLASFDMAVIDQGARVFESRVVIGKARRHRTPEFSDEMEHVVVNPTWNVPSSIARNEILPELQRDPNYLANKNMRISGVDDPSAIDWSTVTPSTFPGRVKQAPGSGNALGRVKFLFPNRHAIYLHDTPSKSLFNRDTRAYSHGCVRVQRPFEFAEYLFSAQYDDPRGSFDRMLHSGRERWVNLEEHVPVHITYRTAWVDGAGVDQFRGDIYGRDAKVLAALEKAGVALPAR